MLSNVSKKKALKKRLSELCVCGYIRSLALEIRLPTELQQLCVKMYMELPDEWNNQQCNIDIKIDSETQTAVSKGTGSWENAFGKDIVKRGMLNVWKFEMNRKRDIELKVAIFVGIIESKNVSRYTNGFCLSKKNGGCGLYTWHGHLYGHGKITSNYGKPCKAKDILEMTLDMTQKSKTKMGVLSFKINNQDYGIAFDDIDIEKEYCLCVSLYDSKDSITIL